MRIDKTIEKRFENLARWIKDEIPRTISQPKIWNAFLKYSQLSPSAARIALSYNKSSPTIDCAVMVGYGYYWSKKDPNKIFINRRLCRKFDKLDPDILINTNYGLIMMATILHEIVHWGDYITDGIHQPNASVYDDPKEKWKHNADVGFQFEAEAFYGIYTKEYLNLN